MSIENYKELVELELERLRRSIQELQLTILSYETILKENNLLDQVAQVSDVEQICFTEILKLKELSGKRGLNIEEVKILDILHKNLLQAKGKLPIDEGKNKKKDQVDVAKLLSIVSEPGNV